MILQTLKDFFTKRGKWNEFYDCTSKLLEDVRALSLSWAKAWTFGSSAKPGGPWVSETYLAFAGIAKAVVSNSTTLLVNTSDKTLVQQCIFSWNTLIALILQPVRVTDEMCMEVEALVKLFLSHFAELELKINDGKVKRIESSPSIMSLLNMSGDMRLHGTLRNMWEGSYFGEGMFRVVKSLVSRGLHCPGTSRSILQKYYTARELDCLIKEVQQKEDDDKLFFDDDTLESDTMEAMRYRSFHSYKSINVVRHDTMSKKPLAVLYCPLEEAFFVLIREGRSSQKLYEISFDDILIVNGIACVDGGMITQHQGVNMKHVSGYLSCMLLPITSEEGVTYFLISEDHKEYNFVENKFVSPQIYISS